MILLHLLQVVLLGLQSAPADVCKVLAPEIAQSYQGGCKKGLAHGRGKATGVNTYEGNFVKGLPHGIGKYIWENGSFFDGMWKSGKREGKGVYFDAIKNTTITGIWKNDRFVKSSNAPLARETRFQVLMQRGIDRVRFVRIGEGNRVLFKFSEMSGQRPVQNLWIDGTSGHYDERGGQISFENIAFPFEGRIRFSALTKLKTGIVDCEIRFVINEPGLWEFTLAY